MNKAIFLDRDGTINVEKNYLSNIDDFEFIDGVREALFLLQNAGFLLIIITNQSGIARNYYTEKDLIKINDYMMSELEKSGIHISKVFYCPHHPKAINAKYRKDCACRKPGIALFNKAVQDFDIDLNYSFAIGDKIRDCSICKITHCKGYLIGNNEEDRIVADVKNGKYANVFWSPTILECAKMIVD